MLPQVAFWKANSEMMAMHEGIRHCYNCNKDFIEEEWWVHPCVEAKRPVKDITIDYLFETTEDDGSKTFHAYGLNGNVYNLNLPTPDKLAELKKTTDEPKQEDYSEWVRRHPDSGREGLPPRGRDTILGRPQATEVHRPPR